jgi:hypothetical protein
MYVIAIGTYAPVDVARGDEERVPFVHQCALRHVVPPLIVSWISYAKLHYIRSGDNVQFYSVECRSTHLNSLQFVV